MKEGHSNSNFEPKFTIFVDLGGVGILSNCEI